MIVIESPEPLDFTDEITLTMSHVTYRATWPTLPDSLPTSRSRDRLPSIGTWIGSASANTPSISGNQDRVFELVAIGANGQAMLKEITEGSDRDGGVNVGNGRTLSLTGIDSGLRLGDRLVLDANDSFTGLVFERIETPVDVRVLQNGGDDQILVIPVDGAGTAAPLAAGQYLLRFQMERQRWETSDAADNLNTYARETTLTLRL